MARPLRIEYEGAVYHVTSRGDKGKEIFRHAEDGESFLALLQQINRRYHWLCHAYCLMENHNHLLIETPEGNLSQGMRQLNGVYTQGFNRRHDHPGHVFQGRFRAIVLEKESQLLELCRYVALNPVRAKLVDQPGKWPWSSYGGTAGLEVAHPCLTVDWLLDRFAAERSEAQRMYQAFVEEEVQQAGPWKGVRGQIILGDEEFTARMQTLMENRKELAEIAKEQQLLRRPGLEQLLPLDAGLSKTARNEKIREAVERYGYSQHAVAQHTGLHFTTISRILLMKG
ncbi:MAG: transposase [Coprothermobacterota bacterium]|nr:transposase [Coprothermobacterota bacterium]